MKPAAESIASDMEAQPSKWRVDLRDGKGRVLPVMVPEAASAHVAISTAMNRMARFHLGTDWTPVCARRTL